jgi:hypothetical protein
MWRWGFWVQKECVCGVKKNLSDREDGEEGDDEGDDTEEEISIVPTEVTNEVLPNILHKIKELNHKCFLQYILLIFKWASPSVSFPRLVNL